MNIEFCLVLCGEDLRCLDVDFGARVRVEVKIYDGGFGVGWVFLLYCDCWFVINCEGYGCMEFLFVFCGEFLL